MKKIKYLLPFIALGLTLTSCSNANGLTQSLDDYISGIDPYADIPWDEYDNPLTEFAFKDAEKGLEIEVDDTHRFTEYTYAPKDALLRWSTSNETVATIDQTGLFTAHSVGEVMVTVSGSERSALAPVSVAVKVIKKINDFSLSSVVPNLDFGEKYQIPVTFDPEDTSQRELTYTVQGEGEPCVVVSEDGVITALNKAGHASIQVSSAYINTVRTFEVDVTDKNVYIELINAEVSGGEIESGNKLEVGKTTTLGASILPNNATYQTLNFETANSAFVSIDSTTGAITALKEGEAKVNAYVNETRKGLKTLSNVVTINVYEVKTEELHLDTNSVSLDNIDNPTHQFVPSFVTDTLGRDTPSKSNLEYTIDDSSVATITQDGLLTCKAKGDAVVTLTDKYSGKSDTCNVHVTIKSESVVLSASSTTPKTDETVTLTATISPKGVTDDSAVFTVTSGDQSELTLTQDGDKLSVFCNVEEGGTYSFTASNGGHVSNEVTLTFTERPVYFDSGNFYLVGSSSYRGGESSDLEGGSWDQAKYAYKFTEKTGNLNAKYEYKAVVHFREGDYWKIREGGISNGYLGYKYPIGYNMPPEYEGERYRTGEYRTSEGPFLTGDMMVDDTHNSDILVNKTGWYEVYYAYYDDNPDNKEGWYSISVVESGLTLDASKVTLVLNGEDVNVTASNWSGQLQVNIEDTTLASYTITGASNNIIKFHALKVGATTVTIRETEKNQKTYVLPLKVLSTAPVFDAETHYIVGNADFSTQIASQGDSWEDASSALALTASASHEGLKGQWECKVKLNSGNKFKFTLGANLLDVYAEQVAAIPNSIYKDDNDYGNYYVRDTGYYIIYLKQGSDDGYSTYIDRIGDLYFDYDSASIEVNETSTVTVHNVFKDLVVSSSDESVIQILSGISSTIQYKGVGAGTADIIVNDAKGKEERCTITVSAVKPEFEEGKYYLVGNKDYSGSSSATGTSWNDVTRAHELVASGSEYKVTMTFAAGDEFRIRYGKTYPTGMGVENNGAIIAGQMYVVVGGEHDSNIHVNVAGTYDIYYKPGSNSVYISLESQYKFFTVEIQYDHFFDGNDSGNAWLGIWAWSGSGAGHLYTCVASDGNRYKFVVPSNTDSYNILRIAPGASSQSFPDGGNLWGQSGDHTGDTVSNIVYLKGYYPDSSYFEVYWNVI